MKSNSKGTALSEKKSISERAAALVRPPAPARPLRPIAPHLLRAAEEPTIPASFPLGPSWHVVMTNIKCEFRAKMGLQARGFAVYLPVEKRIVRHARRKEKRVFPLFRRYLFVAFDIERDEWYEPIRSTDGVADLLCYPRIPATRNADAQWIPLQVPPAQIETLRRKEAAGDFDYTNPRSAFTPGEKVRVAHGALAGLDAIVHATPPNKRVELLLDLLGRKTVVKLEAGEIERV